MNVASPVSFLYFRYYFFVPYEEEKPLLYVKGIFEDHRKRMYGTNMIEKVAEKLVSLGEKKTTLASYYQSSLLDYSLTSP